MQAYIVKISIDQSLAVDYYEWLKDHIQGNREKNMKGMMELMHEGFFLFNKTEIWTAEVGDQKLFDIKYYTFKTAHINTYLEHYAAQMRADVPAEFLSNMKVNRAILEDRRQMAMEPFDKDELQKFMDNKASFSLLETLN